VAHVVEQNYVCPVSYSICAASDQIILIVRDPFFLAFETDISYH